MKKLTIMFFAILGLFLFLASNVGASTQIQTATSTPTFFTPTITTVPIAATPDTSYADRLLVLETEINLIAKSQELLLDTIKWTMGILSTIFIAILGLGIYSNIKTSQQEKELIKTELTNYIQTTVSDSAKILTNQFNEFKQEITVNQQNNINISVELLKSELSNEIKDLKMFFEFQQKSLYELSLEIQLLEAKIWTLKEIPTNAFVTGVSALELCIKKEMGARIPRCLTVIKEAANKITSLSISKTSELTDLLNKLPNKYENEINEIKKSLANMETY